MATLLAVGYQPEELRAIMEKKSFKDFLKEEDENLKDEGVLKIAETLSKGVSLTAILKCFYYACIRYPAIIYEFITFRGISTGENFRKWMDELISRKVAAIETGNENNYLRYQYLTMGQLAQLIAKQRQKNISKNYRDLYVVGAVYPREFKKGQTPKEEVFNTEEKAYEDFIISDCVRISMSIPFIFRPHSKFIRDPQNGERKKLETSENKCVDGGVLGPCSNYPMHIFDKNRYLSTPSYKTRPNEDVPNWETLGFNLYNKTLTEPLADWIISTVGIIKNPPKRSNNNINLSDNECRDIFIDVREITLFDFSISQQKMAELVHSGRSHVSQYWSNDKIRLLEEQKRLHDRVYEENQEVFDAYKSKTNLSNNKIYIIPDEYEDLRPFLENYEARGSASIRRLGITGVIGSGKTALAGYCAKKFIENHVHRLWKADCLLDQFGNLLKNRVPVVWLCNAESEETLRDAFENLIRCINPDRFKLIYKNSQTPIQTSHLIAQVQSALKQFPNYMLILHKVSDHEIIKPFMQDFGDSRAVLLITTQNLSPSDHRFDATVNLNNGLSIEQSKYLLSRVYGIKPADIPDKLFNSDFLGSLPHDLHTVGYYLKNNPSLTVQKHMDNLIHSDDSFTIQTKNRRFLLNRLIHEPHGDIALDVLTFCAFLNPNAISEDLLKKYVKKRFSNENILKDALAVIQKYGFLWQDSTDQPYKIHPITQRMIRKQYVNPHGVVEKDIISTLNKALDDYKASQENDLLLHAEKMIALFEEQKVFSKIISVKLAYLMETTANIHLHSNDSNQLWHQPSTASPHQRQHNIKRGAELLKKALTIFQSQPEGDYTEQISRISLRLSKGYALLGESELCKREMNYALNHYEKIISPTHSKMGAILINAACIHALINEKPQGIPIAQKGYEILTHHYDEKSVPIQMAFSLLEEAGYTKAEICPQQKKPATHTSALSSNSQTLLPAPSSHQLVNKNNLSTPSNSCVGPN